MKKIFLVIVAVICAMLPLVSGMADGSFPENEKELIERLRVVPEFKFQNHEEPISEGSAPVYTAPSTDAYRCANGKARCDFGEMIGEANYIDGWLLVRYEISEDNMRVGYVQKKHVPGFISSMKKLTPEKIPLTAAEPMKITDDPSRAGVPFGTIEKGDTFYVLMKYTYTGNWWYVECVIDGKTARGFVDRTTAKFYIGEHITPAEETKIYTLDSIGYPEASPEGKPMIGHVEINPGVRKPVKIKPDKDSTQITVAYPDRYYPCYDISEQKRGTAWYYVWVETDSKWGWVQSINGTFVPEK